MKRCPRVEERFHGWTLIYLKRANSDVEVVPYDANPSSWSALEKVLDDGFRWIYLIWHSNSNLENFHMVYSQNSVCARADLKEYFDIEETMHACKFFDYSVLLSNA